MEYPRIVLESEGSMSPPVLIQGQERTIEKRGLLILSEEEKASHILEIWFSVLQFPYEHSVNYLYPREKSLYARYNYLSQGYVTGTEIVYYQNCRIIRVNRQIEASTEGLGCYLDTVFRFFVVLAPLVNQNFSWTYTREPIHIYPPNFDSIAFVLPEGCVAKISTTGYRMQGCLEPATDLLEPPPPPPLGDPPRLPPDKNQPPTTGIPGSGAPLIISPPYDQETNDGGDTYVPPDIGFQDTQTQLNGEAWIVTVELDWRYKSDDSPVVPTPGKYNAEALIFGKYKKTGYNSGAEFGGTGGYVEFQRFSSSSTEQVGVGGSTSRLDIYPKTKLIGLRKA